MDSQDNLIACRLNTLEEIAADIGTDSLAYLSVNAVHRLTGRQQGMFCDGCFTGKYPIDITENQGKNKFEQPLPPCEPGVRCPNSSSFLCTPRELCP